MVGTAHPTMPIHTMMRHIPDPESLAKSLSRYTHSGSIPMTMYFTSTGGPWASVSFTVNVRGPWFCAGGVSSKDD